MDAPRWIIDNRISTGFIEYKGNKISYSILKKELEPKLPGFLGYFEGKFLFISEEVPEKFRHLQLIHEVIEFTELKGEKGRCLAALKEELKLISSEDMKEYVSYRKKFFKNLVEYYEHGDNKEFKREIQASFEFLRNFNRAVF
jgi:hypothetical protein